MAIDFPNSPALDDVYTVGSRTWTWTGTNWELKTGAFGAGTVGTTELADSSVTTAKIAAGAAVSNIGYTPANVAGPTFTGTVVLPSTTSIGTVSATEIGYVDGVTSAIQTQLDSKLTATTAVTSGRNMVVNGDFKIWQRGTSFSSPANATFTADRWFMYYDGSGATRTISQQTFTGDNPTGLNVSNYMRVAITVAGTGSTTNGMFCKIEDVRKLNGQTVTLSFYGKADASRTVNWQTYQEFGASGSSAVQANSTNFSFTSSWQRFSASFTMPSVSGKTITSNSSISFLVAFPVNATGTFDITGVQLEAGAVATPFEFEDFGTTLAKCQRYYQRRSGEKNYGLLTAQTGSNLYGVIPLPVSMRVAPTSIDAGSLRAFDLVNAAQVFYTFGLDGTVSTENMVGIAATATGFTAFRTYYIIHNGASSYLGFSAEL
jgi:hypothetical protein